MYGNAPGVGCFRNKRSPKVELRSAYVEDTLRGSPKVDLRSAYVKNTLQGSPKVELRSSMSRTPCWVQGHYPPFSSTGKQKFLFSFLPVIYIPSGYQGAKNEEEWRCISKNRTPTPLQRTGSIS